MVSHYMRKESWEYMHTFKELGLSELAINKLKKLGIQQPTPIQEGTIPFLMKGKDVIAQAQTGTGKTFAFTLPILEKVNSELNHVQALILTPTRELAIQITAEINKVKEEELQVLAVYGGQDVEKQLKQLKGNTTIVIATPGRLIDHIKRGNIDLSHLSYLVLDEADQMLHIGFLDEIGYIIRRTPTDRQTMLFSATISKEVQKLAKKYTIDAEYISVEKKQGPALTVKQVSIHTPDRAKQGILMSLVKEYNPYMAIIFCRTKRRVSKLYEVLRANHFNCNELHGDLSQAKREQVMKDFRNGKYQLLIATDVAARGLDIDGITHVFNYDIPLDAESYVHRIGRTGRAGLDGFAITFYSSDDRPLLDSIEEELRIKIEKLPQPKASKSDEKPANKEGRPTNNKSNRRNTQKGKTTNNKEHTSSRNKSSRKDDKVGSNSQPSNYKTKSKTTRTNKKTISSSKKRGK